MTPRKLMKTKAEIEALGKRESHIRCKMCYDMPHRVDGIACKRCGLRFEEEVIEVPFTPLTSSAGSMFK